MVKILLSELERVEKNYYEAINSTEIALIRATLLCIPTLLDEIWKLRKVIQMNNVEYVLEGVLGVNDMTLAKKIFDARGFDFRRDFTEEVFNRIICEDVEITFPDKAKISDVVARWKTGFGILITTWDAHIGIHVDDVAKGYDHVMSIY